jgi:hypothetical protein
VVPIDIRKFDESLETIRNTIRSGAWEKNLEALKEARRRVLEEYHLFAVLEKLISEAHDQTRSDRGTLIRSRKAARNQSLVQLVSHGLQVVRTRLWHSLH